MGPFIFADVPGVLRLEDAEGGADPVDATVTMAWGTGSFSKVAVVNKDVKGEGVISTGALAVVFVEAEGFGVFLLEHALGSTVPSATKQTGEAPEIRVGPFGEGALACPQALNLCGWLGEVTAAAALVGSRLS